MPWTKALAELAKATLRNPDKITKPFPVNQTTISNVVKTVDLRIDIHQDSADPNKAVAKIQANAQAEDSAVKEFIRSGNKGEGHKGTHKNVAIIPFDREAFDVKKFVEKIENAK